MTLTVIQDIRCVHPEGALEEIEKGQRDPPGIACCALLLRLSFWGHPEGKIHEGQVQEELVREGGKGRSMKGMVREELEREGF